MKETEIIENLTDLLRQEVKNLPQDLAIAFSGGLDSAIISKLIKQEGKNQVCYVVGKEGSQDILVARKVAREIGVELNEIIIDREYVKEAMNVQIKILERLYQEKKEEINAALPPLKPTPVSVSFNLPLFFVCKKAKEKLVVSGQGADTILGGFAKYLNMNKEKGREEMMKDTKDLVNVGYLQHERTGEYFKKKIPFIFLNKKIAEYCLSIPYNLKVREGIRKYILTKVATNIGLSEETSLREKKSAQYGSKIMDLMKKVAKDNDEHVGKYIDNIRKKIKNIGCLD